MMYYDIDNIWITLGYGCNNNCRYCQQYVNTEKPIVEYNPDIVPWLAKTNPAKIFFYGGEPLLYFDIIKKVTIGLKENDFKGDLIIITNGRAFTQDIIDFINKYNININLSWDGPRTEEVRLYDPLKDENHKNLLFGIKNLRIHSVLSHFNYPSELFNSITELDKEYRQVQGHNLGFSMTSLRKMDESNDELYNVNFSKVSKEIKEWLNKELEEGTVKQYFIRTMRDFLVMSISTKNGSRKRYASRCCTDGLLAMNINAHGDFLTCHNSTEIFGNIYMDSRDYLYEVIKRDKWLQKENPVCDNCDLQGLCFLPCKLYKDDNWFTCEYDRAWKLPILNQLNNFGFIEKKEHVHCLYELNNKEEQKLISIFNKNYYPLVIKYITDKCDLRLLHEFLCRVKEKIDEDNLTVTTKIIIYAREYDEEYFNFFSEYWREVKIVRLT